MPNRRTSVASVNHHVAHDTLIARGTISFAADDTLTTEKQTAAISLLNRPLPQDHRIAVFVSRPDDAAAGSLTAKLYVVCKIDGTNVENCLAGSGTVENVVGARGAETFVFDVGAGLGQGTIILGAVFAGDSVSAVDVLYAVYPV